MSVRSARAEKAADVLVTLAPALLATYLVHQNVVTVYFAQDDVTLVARAADLAPRDPSFRPLSADLAFRAMWKAFGVEPFGYHVVNLFLHLANVVGVYAIAHRLMGATAAGATAVLFGASGIAFTPTRWASGIMELSACAGLLAATWVHLVSQRRGALWRGAAAALALAAMFCKETAAAWVLVVAFLESRRGDVRARAAAIAPAALATLAFACVWLATGQHARYDAEGAYARSADPEFLLRNLATYLAWVLAVWNPIRDTVASVDPNAWRIAVPGVALLACAFGWAGEWRSPIRLGIVWWIVFLLPVLPLAHHTYLYYLYVPWAGGAIAVTALGAAFLARPRFAILRRLVPWVLAVWAAVEWRNVSTRETMTRDHLPIDRTMRDALLLGNAIPALRAAHLPPGTPVLFVSPRSRARFDLVTGAPTREEHFGTRRSYRPLEAAMRDGEALRLLTPHLEYRGFAATIPPDAGDAEIFHYDQRGRLERWGRGAEARARQARFLAEPDLPETERAR